MPGRGRSPRALASWFGLCCACTALCASAASEIYHVRETVTFINDGPGACTQLRVVIGLFRDWAPYIDVISEAIEPQPECITTDEFGNRYAEITIRDIAPGSRIPVTLDWQIEVTELSFDLSGCDGSPLPEDVRRYLDPEPFIESTDGPITALANTLVRGRRSSCEMVEAIYDYVISNIEYEGYVPEPRGALDCLRTQRGDCTEFAALMTALCRAVGIPARVIEGVTNQANDEVHSWLEAYLPGLGWVPFDPTWGRHPRGRERYLAATTPDHVPLAIGIGLEALNGYSYWAYWYWWDSEGTSVSTTGYDWVIR